MGGKPGLSSKFLFPYPLGREGCFSPVERLQACQQLLAPRLGSPILLCVVKGFTSTPSPFACTILPEEETTTASTPKAVPGPQPIILVG